MGNAAEKYDEENLGEKITHAKLNPASFNVPKNGSSDNYGAAEKDADSGESDSQRLNNARQKNNVSKSLNDAKELAKNATPMGAISLLGHIHFLGDMPYVAALGAAILKDILDLVFVGSLPGLGTVITILCSVFIAMMMMLVGSGGKRKAVSGMLKKFGTLLAGTLAEGVIPGINFLPMESIMVASVYVMTLTERKNEGD